MNEKLRILLVDDERDIHAVLAPLLGPEFEVVSAFNGLDALLKLPRYEPDLLIVDLMMPLMDGWELAERVRKHPDFQTTPMIFLTALDSRDTMKKGYEAGATVYLTKPFDPTRVKRNIQICVERDNLKPRPKQMSLRTLRDREEPADDVKVPSALPTVETDSASIVRKVGAPLPKGKGKTGAARSKRREGSSSPLAHDALPVSAGFPAPPRVLVVDDDPEIVDLLRLALQRGFEIVTARDGLDALTKISELQPDLYVVDIMMPKMSGLQLLQLLRQSADTRTAPVIVLSAKSSSRDREYARSIGANAYLTKPFLTSEVIAELERQTQRPGFAVIFPKRKSLDRIHDDAGTELDADECREKKRLLRQTFHAIEDFLQRHGDQDPFGGRTVPQ